MKGEVDRIVAAWEEPVKIPVSKGEKDRFFPECIRMRGNEIYFMERLLPKVNSNRAQHFIRETLRQQGAKDKVRLKIHWNRGSPMTASNTVELLAVLGLAQSFARLRSERDNRP